MSSDPFTAQSSQTPLVNTSPSSLPSVEPTPVKPGWQTSEWWVTILTQVLGLLVTLGVVKPQFATDASTNMAIQIIAGVLAMVLPQVVYTWSRTHVKKAAIQATAATATN